MSALPPTSACSALRAAGEIGDLDLEPLVLEVALALGHGERQVVEEGLAADRDGDLLLLGACASAASTGSAVVIAVPAPCLPWIERWMPSNA